ncbi:MAG: hypothetical protein BM563_10240 [Bacteroidetes bacterium MedPE-SWsnd-G1]|nr:MAG: hypothetical protein BM563_10240 [Bacteroidetes bacterium MedPE-SWsnd-G1]
MSNEHHSDIFLRPRFSIDVKMSQDALISLLNEKLNSDVENYKSKKVDHHFFVDISQNKQHYWSPQLHIEALNDFNGGSIVKGLFTPRPHVWTLFIFMHLIAGAVFLIFSIMLYVRWTLEGNLLFPAIMTILTPILWLGFYIFGRWGRRQGKDQMVELYKFLRSSINN